MREPPHVFDCLDDEAAGRKAVQLLDGRPVEVWITLAASSGWTRRTSILRDRVELVCAKKLTPFQRTVLAPCPGTKSRPENSHDPVDGLEGKASE